MISKDEARKVAKEMMELLPSKLTEHDPNSVGFFLACLLYEIIESTRLNISIQEAFTLMNKHHQIVDTLVSYYTLRKMQGYFDESH